VRSRPWAFALTAIGGLIVGVALMMIASRQDVTPPWLLWGFGGLCVIFYTAMLVMLFVKLRRREWVAFCSSQIVVVEEFFEDRT
jgi:hypothetical protein